MGVYGTTYKSAFNGLGKPSIKLEFEDNDDLLAFQQRMQEANDGDNPDDTPDGGGNFTPGEQVLDRLSRIATGRPYLKATPGGEVSDEEPVAWNEEKGEFEPLEGYGDFYTVRDMRKRSRKEPGDVAANKNLQFTKDATKTIKNFNHKFYLAAQAQQDRLGLFPNELEFDGKLYEKINIYNSKDGWYFNIDIFLPKKKNPNNTFKGYTENYAVYVDIDKCINIAPTGSGGAQAYITKDYYTELFSSAILAYYNILVKRRAFYIEKKYDTSEIDKEIKYYALYYSNPAKYQALHMTGYAIGSAAYEAKKYAKPGIFDGLGSPGDTYIITDTRTRARKDLEDTAALKKYDIRKFSGEELQKMQTDDPLLYEQIKSDITGAPASITLGRAAASDALYNNNDIIDTRGLKPTYKILQSYDAFFAPAQHSQTFAGVGLSDTKKLIAEICRAHYKDCARIAQHLKADTKLQSVFNLWHWLRHNIRYEYDREGREEVRTPLRTWADRRRGVDCDCLSVFAWCVLKCMGYDPAFELVSFNGKAAPSHILVNLDGIRLDRVWFVFNALPPGVTGSEIYRVNAANNSILAGLFN